MQAVDGLTSTCAGARRSSLVGESGCGKTTTGRLLTRLLEPTGGTVTFEGRDITHLGVSDMRPLRRDIQMIFQDPYSSLNPRHTVGTIIGAPFKIQGVEPKGGVKQAVQDLLDARRAERRSTTTATPTSSPAASASASGSRARSRCGPS